MPNTSARESNSQPLSAEDLEEARWMEITQKTRVPRPGGVVSAPEPARRLAVTKSYHDTRWPVVNQALALTEQLTGGRAGVIQRLFTYLMIGGTAALVNLSILAIFEHFGSLKTLTLYTVIGYFSAYEISILTNFIPNDYFTFRFLPGHQRSWLARCLRFHLTSLSGVAVTFALSWIFYHPFDLRLLVAQALALILAVFYNFTAHHLFTYAHKR